jgi:hypothetical protein
VSGPHIFVDETKHTDYIMVACIVRSSDLRAARAAVGQLLHARSQRRLHMKSESDARRKQIADALDWLRPEMREARAPRSSGRVSGSLPEAQRIRPFQHMP